MLGKKYREEIIIGMIPLGVKTILDVGSRNKNNFFKKKFKVITLDILDANIIQDINQNQFLPLKDNSVDCIVLSQILEHLVWCETIIAESKRVAKKYILVGLPNELTISNRIRFLFGKYPLWSYYDSKGAGSYNPSSHKHFFIIKNIERFITSFFGGYSKRNFIFGISGGRFLPNCIRNFLAWIYPSLFASQVYYLIDKKEGACPLLCGR